MSIKPATNLSRRRALALAAGGLALLCGGAVALSFADAMRRAEQRLAGASEVIATRFGRLEYAAKGSGPPVMMIHGTGGGFDQGLSFAEGLARRGHRVIAPSRFGYLRSDFPADPSSENQADALVALLDHLGIDRLPVAGGSAGALAAIQFALRHPDRCSLLVLLVPAANVSGRDPVEMTGAQKFLVEHVLGSDFLFWAVRQAAPGQLVGTLLATDPALLDTVDPRERARAYRILDELLPVSRRSRGLLNDARLAGAPHPVDYRRIRVPTLVLSVEDDRFGTAATARHLAATIPDATLVMLERGGHIWLGGDEAVSDHVARFLRARGPAPDPRP